MSEFVYHAEARALTRDLEEIKVAGPAVREPDLGALERIVRGKTAFADMEAEHAATAAAAKPSLQAEELKKKLQGLLKVKSASLQQEQARVLGFIEQVKQADAASPDVALNAMTTAGGVSESDGEAAERGNGGSQGPAANLIAKGLKALNRGVTENPKEPGVTQHLAASGKVAASRLDKEVAKGTVTLQQAAPGAVSKTDARRNVFHQGTGLDPDRLERRRALHAAVHRNSIRRGTIENYPTSAPSTYLTKPRGAGAYKQVVNAPENSGGWLRNGSHTQDPSKLEHASLEQLGAMMGPAKDVKPVDRTLGRAVMEHELGERDTMRRPDWYSHASHAGPEPVMRENLHTVGDAEAQNIFRKMRSHDPDDARVAKYLRSIGHHPDAPLPVGGKHQRALEGIMKKHVNKFTGDNQRHALKAHLEVSAPEVRTALGISEVREHGVSPKLLSAHHAAEAARERHLSVAKQKIPLSIGGALDHFRNHWNTGKAMRVAQKAFRSI